MRMSMQAIEIIQGCTLLNALSHEERQELAGSMQVRTVPKGELIWFGGDPQGYFGIVGTGFIKMSRPSFSGQEVAMELMGPGQVFGLNGIIDGRGCPLNATALTLAVYGYLPGDRILPVFERNVAFKDTLLRRAMTRLHEKVDLMARMTSGRVEQRIAAILLILAQSYGAETPDGVVLHVPLTRQEIGELAGTTTESAIRLLSRWQKEGMVSTEHQNITLHNMSAIEAIFAET